jgi:tetratricopeptide (TPR) repeat protein
MRQKTFIGYLPLQPNEFLPTFVQFFNPAKELVGTSAGIRIEAFIACLLSFIYVFLKRRSLWRSLLATFAIYATSFVFFTFPFLVFAILKSLSWLLPYTSARDFLEGQGTILRNGYLQGAYSIAHLDLFLALIILVGWFLLYRRGRGRFPWAALEWPWMLHFVVTAVLGQALAFRLFSSVGDDLRLTHFFDYLALLSPLVSTALGYIAVRAWAASQHGSEDRRELPAVAFVSLVFSLAFALVIGYPLVVLTLVFVSLLFLHEIDPFRLRRLPVISATVRALASLACVLLGFSLLGRNSTPEIFPHNLLLLIFAALTLGLHAGETSRADAWGRFLARGGAGILSFAAYLLVPAFLGSPRLLFASLVFGAAGLLVALLPPPRRWLTSAVYVLFAGLVLTVWWPDASRGIARSIPAPNKLLSTIFEAHTYMRSGMEGQALVEYQQAIDAGTKDVTVFAALGEIYYRRNEIARAIEMYEQAIALDSTLVRARGNLGICYMLKERIPEARAQFEKVKQLDPEDQGASYYLDQLDQPTPENLSEALKQAREGVKEMPQDPQAHLRLAMALEETGQLDEAQREFAAVVSLMPGHAEALFHLGAIREAKGDIQEAMAWYRRAIAGDPENPLYHTALANALIRIGQWDSAARELEKVVAVTPDDATARVNLAVYYQKLGRQGEVEKHLLEALRVEPRNTVARYNLALHYRKTGQPQRATEQLLELLRLDSRNAAAHNLLGLLYAQQQQFSKARAEWERALTIDPASREARESLAQLEKIGQ